MLTCDSFRHVLKNEICQKTCKLLLKKIFFSPSIRMSKKSINFRNKNINKSNFHKNNKIFKIGNIDANKMLVQYCIGYDVMM